jgi:hypothetical protein
MADSFTPRDLGVTIAKLLDLAPGSDIEIQRDKFDSNRLMVIKLTDGSGVKLND